MHYSDTHLANNSRLTTNYGKRKSTVYVYYISNFKSFSMSEGVFLQKLLVLMPCLDKSVDEEVKINCWGSI